MLAAALLLLPVGAAETLMQREYGDINAGLDDGAHHVQSCALHPLTPPAYAAPGFGYDGWDQPGDPEAAGFATGYLLTDAAGKSDAKCLDG